MIRRLALIAMLAATPARAQLCDGASTPISADGRALGHLPYGDVAEGELAPLRSDLTVNAGCRLRREMLPDLERMLTAAAGDPAVGGRILALSCHRSLARQGNVFCRGRGDANAADRAISVAPPGHSEHTTGFALDVAIRPRGDCPDAEACMAATPGFRWLTANAARYGFEMSFPAGNRQRVKWEPWHWRWVGTTAAAPGAAKARFVFAGARARFPATPGVDTAIVLRGVPAPPVYLALPPWKDPKGWRRKRRR